MASLLPCDFVDLVPTSPSFGITQTWAWVPVTPFTSGLILTSLSCPFLIRDTTLGKIIVLYLPAGSVWEVN